MTLRGAEAVVSKRGSSLVKKRLAKKYRHPALDERLRSERTRREAKILSRANAAGISTPKFLGSDDQKKEILFSEIRGKQAKSAKLTPALLREIGTQLAKLHDAGIAHGDFTTSNVMVSGDKAFIIDFGFGEFTNSVELFATDLVLFQKTVTPAEFAYFLEGYSRAKARPHDIVERMAEINKRGRYVER